MLALSACAPTLKRSATTPGDAHGEQQLERLRQASADLERLEVVDLRLRIDNAILQPAIEASLAEAFDRVPAWTTERLSVAIYSGYVAVDAVGRYRQPDSEQSAEQPPATDAPAPRYRLVGDVLLNHQSGRISWHPEFHDLVALDQRRPQSPADDPDPEEGNGQTPLNLLEAAVRAELAAAGRHYLPIDPMPLGVLETGIRLSAPFPAVIAESSLLAGVLTTGGTAVLIEPDVTSFALDLGFMPSLPNCRATVGTGRVTFAGEVRNREPVNTAVLEGTAAQTRFFFTDITGARAETAVVHYWFADGRPASITELRVGRSARWRTWSERPEGLQDVRRWQVLVIEKTTGCILDQRSIVLAPAPAARPAAPAGPDGAAPTVSTTYDALLTAFDQRMVGLPPAEPLSGAIAVDVQQAFFASAIAEALYDLRLVFSTDVQTGRPISIQAALAPFPAGALSCDARACEATRVCTVDFDDCPVRQDTRDCRSCLFRNPLNNRCMREAEDPICLAARDAENLRLEDRRQSCIADQTRQRDACLAARDRDLANCRARATRERTDCANQANAMADRRVSGRPIATLGGAASLTGAMTVEFSEFRVTPDLEQVRMQLAVSADLGADGTLEFEPDPELSALAECLRPVQAALKTRLNLPPWQAGLATRLETNGAALEANWSGLVQERQTYPSLIEQLLDDHPELFERCALEFDTSRVETLISGTGASLLHGALPLDLQPEPTRITLLPAYLETDAGTWTGNPVVSGTAVSYRLDEMTPRPADTSAGAKAIQEPDGRDVALEP